MGPAARGLGVGLGVVGLGTWSFWPTLRVLGSVMPLMRASSSAVVPNCWAMDDRESPCWTVYSSNGDGSGVGLGAGVGVPPAWA